MNAHRGPGQLGEFLRARRSRLSPSDLGLPSADDRRRVPGLRREEVALLAGVSASYYARLEQGTSFHASAEVLDALARALELDEGERRHLHDLADRRRLGRPDRPTAERVAPALAQLLLALDGVPALVLGRRLDILAWNPLGHALIADHLDVGRVDRPAERPNSAVLAFLDPRARTLYADWSGKARAVVSQLRLVAGRHPDDALFAALIGELTIRSPEFALLWADHAVGSCDGSTYTLDHPLVGSITVNQQTLQPSGADQSLVTFTVDADTASEAALRLLRHRTPPSMVPSTAGSRTAAGGLP